MRPWIEADLLDGLIGLDQAVAFQHHSDQATVLEPGGIDQPAGQHGRCAGLGGRHTTTGRP